MNAEMHLFSKVVAVSICDFKPPVIQLLLLGIKFEKICFKLWRVAGTVCVARQQNEWEQLGYQQFWFMDQYQGRCHKSVHSCRLLSTIR